MAVDDFRGANECPENEKVYPTLEAKGVLTPFIQKWLNSSDLLGPVLNSRVGGIYYCNYLLGLEEQPNYRL